MRAVVTDGGEAESVRHEEEDEGGEDPMQHAGEELALVKQQVELSRPVQSRVPKAELLIHVLQTQGGQIEIMLKLKQLD